MLSFRGSGERPRRSGSEHQNTHSHLESLPTELRLKIFSLVLRGDAPLRRPEGALGDTYVFSTPQRSARTGLTARHRINVSLFTVNKKLSFEARDAFAEANTLSLHGFAGFPWPSEFLRVRNLDLRGEAALRVFQTGGKDMLLGAFESLPHLRVTSIIFEQNDIQFRRVREIAATFGDFKTPDCVSLGVWQIESDISTTTRTRKIVFACRSFSKHLPRIRQLLDEHDLGELLAAAKKLSEGQGYLTDEYRVTKLALWLATYDMWRRGEGPGIIGAASVMCMFFGQRLAERQRTGAYGVQWVRSDLPKTTRLVDVTLEEHETEMVEWATGVLMAALRSTIESGPGEWEIGM